MAKSKGTGVTKEHLEEHIKKGNFRISRNFKFKDGQKELIVDYKDLDRNYLIKDKPHLEYFRLKYPGQKFIILED